VRRPWLSAIHVPAYAAEEVTSHNRAAEVEPELAGLSRRDIDTIWAAVVRLYEAGLHPAIALCVRRHGQIVIERAIGHLRGNGPGAPPGTAREKIRYDSLVTLFSASKAVTAMLIHLLDERRVVHLDDPVADYIPEFAQHGKGGITLRQLLTHRAGIPTLPGARVDADLLRDPAAILQLLCRARPLSIPGRRLSYHALTAGFILGEVVWRATGRDIRTFLRDEVLNPLGFASFDYGIAPDRTREVAENALSGLPAVPPHSWLLARALGIDLERAVTLSNDEAFLTAIIPSGNIIGTAEEASRFFQLLLNRGELNGVRVFERRTVRRAIAEQSYLEVDSFLGLPVRYGMGFMLGAARFSPYGSDTPNAFGHIGFTNVIAYADPDRALSVGLMTSGKPFITPGQIAWLNVARTIARVCAGAAPGAP
jgi:CubicO group peptidase (beta-lactamase class C family)